MSEIETERRRTAKFSRVTNRLVIGQGALLFGGYTIAQACALARNILIAYWLSKGDFGIAATILLVLQLVETLSDLGADRLLIQAKDGETPELMAGIHATLVARGLVCGALIYLLAGPTASFFRIEEAEWAFKMVALVPILKAFVHLDVRLSQRHFDNTPFIICETAPQVLACLFAFPILHWSGDFTAAVWIALVQSVTALIASHLLSTRPYRLSIEPVILARIVRFGWPIWLSAFPLIAVYYIDRAIVGRMFGMEALAGYAAAFMLTMVPAMIAARAANALMLPLLVEARANTELLRQRYTLMTELAVLAAVVYVVVSIVAGDTFIHFTFGERYAGLHWVIVWLAIMWGLRMVQAVPGMALLAMGRTTPLLIAGLIRASAVALALCAAIAGYGVEGVAAAGAAGEAAALIYVAYASQGRRKADPKGLTWIYLPRAAFMLPAITLAIVVKLLIPAGTAAAAILSAAALTALSAAALGVALFPELRALIDETRRTIQQNSGTPVAKTEAPAERAGA